MSKSKPIKAWWPVAAILCANFCFSATVYAAASGNQWKPALSVFLAGLTCAAGMAAFILTMLFADDHPYIQSYPTGTNQRSDGDPDDQ